MLAGFLCRRDKSPSRRFITGDRGIATGLFAGGIGFIQVNLHDIERKVLAVVIAVHHHLRVRRDESRFFLELVFQQVDCFLHRLVEQPVDKTEREHVTALEDGFIIHPAVFQRLFGQRRQSHRHDLYRLGNT